MEQKIVMIATDKLYPHPDNPRKDLGDLTELADSIKENGVLQNLTVVKGHVLTDEEWRRLAEEYNENPSEELQRKMNSRRSDDGYTVIIGHRRTAAAKQAGLTELPCVIAEMDVKKQIETMLLENMQRRDLTIYEEAKSFQMLLDLGGSIKEVAESTGFSESTIRRRVRLNEFDDNKFKDAVSRNVTLDDYIKVLEIEDAKERNKVLETAGTYNFEYTLRNALSKQAAEKNKLLALAELEECATKVNCSNSKMIWCTQFGLSTYKPGQIKQLCREDIEYFYILSGHTAYIYKAKPEPEEEIKSGPTAADVELGRQVDKANKAREELKSASEIAYLCRADFVKNFRNNKKPNIILHYLCRIFSLNYAIGNWVGIDEYDLCEFCGYKVPEDDEEIPPIYLFNRICSDKNESAMQLACVYLLFEDSEDNNYYRSGNQQIHPEYEGNPSLDLLYEFLQALGYEMSDTENQLQNGTHPAFETEGE